MCLFDVSGKDDFLAFFKQVAVWNYNFFPFFKLIVLYSFQFFTKKIYYMAIYAIILNEKFFLKKICSLTPFCIFPAILWWFKDFLLNIARPMHLPGNISDVILNTYMVNFSPYIHTMYYYILTYCKSIVSMQRNYGIHGIIFF